jgi:4-hydroxyproline epimerase
MRVIDSHTEGEPTRIIIEGGPDLGAGSQAERRARFQREFDAVRRFAVLEPRGSDAVVGALVTEAIDPANTCGVIFFNNAGYLGMCGHGTVGLAVTLHHLGRIGLGTHTIETPVGVVQVDLLDAATARIGNVESYRTQTGVSVEVDGLGRITGDVAWGGNWFFLSHDLPAPLTLAHVGTLTRAGMAVQRALAAAGITGDDGSEVDHIEFFGPPHARDAHSRNFVLCPGAAYDRSPCGTGTSAKLACLAADGRLAPGDLWVQESVIGSRFEARYQPGPNGGILPEITGRAYVVADSRLIRNPADPFADGIVDDAH